MIPMEPASLVMERKMLRGIEQRAERLAAAQAGAVTAELPCPGPGGVAERSNAAVSKTVIRR